MMARWKQAMGNLSAVMVSLCFQNIDHLLQTNMSFESLGLSEPLLKTIAEQNYTQPYPIQQEAIPAILKGNDVLGIAKTGSGKTASFVLPILEMFHQTAKSSMYLDILHNQLQRQAVVWHHPYLV